MSRDDGKLCDWVSLICDVAHYGSTLSTIVQIDSGWPFDVRAMDVVLAAGPDGVT
jgi:hypothetical protein